MGTRPKCGCCDTVLWTTDEIVDGVCEECFAVWRHPERYRACPEIDVNTIVRKVTSVRFAKRKTRAFQAVRT